jgi:glycerophosphoryl diester phosphodiesterase
MGPIVAEAFRATGIPVAGALIATWDDEQRQDVAAHLAGAEIVRAEGVPASWDDHFFEKSRAAGVQIFDLPDWSPAFVKDAQARGFRVWVYTVNDARTIADVVRQGVDGFETDDPRMAVEALRALAR